MFTVHMWTYGHEQHEKYSFYTTIERTFIGALLLLLDMQILKCMLNTSVLFREDFSSNTFRLHLSCKVYFQNETFSIPLCLN